jgi:hypothetical protein
MIDLNSSEYDQKEGGSVVIFNKGVAGVVNNVTLAVTKKKKEDHEKAPDYKVNFTDSEGGSTDLGLYYVTEATSYSTIDEQVKKQGMVLKHLLRAAISPTFVFPKAENAKQMLDLCMKAVKEQTPAGAKFRVMANYGTKDYPKKFIQARTWVPFIEPVSVAESRLTVSDLDNLTRPTADNESKNDSVADANDLVSDWD